MYVRRDIPWTWTLYYSWPSLTYFLLVSVLVYLFRETVLHYSLNIPREPVTILATALAIFLGFKNNEAYGRWWEARKIWGLAVNYSRAWSRQVLTLMQSSPQEEQELKDFQRRMIYRNLAFVHSLRIYLRTTESYPQELTDGEPSAKNDYSECRTLLSDEEFQSLTAADNPPERLLQRQGQDLRLARNQEWISEYAFIHLDQTLVEFNHIQGKAERIKKTPLPRPYSYFQRLIVHVLGTLLPFALIEQTGWLTIPLSVMVSFVFLSLDLIGSRTEDPFENRVDDTPMSSLCRTIERNARETLGESEIPPPIKPQRGILY
ncbi:bestrophin family protein [Planctomicrobium sp. SH661]|uniref:bestrophin family protein n=1 Tax=Planctomicrobium sp. SH661 TaxID=3448124 RepID=UPI003F5B95CD